MSQVLISLLISVIDDLWRHEIIIGKNIFNY